MINFSKQNKDIPLYLEKKCRVAANPALWEEIYALFFLAPYQAKAHTRDGSNFALFSLDM